MNDIVIHSAIDFKTYLNASYRNFYKRRVFFVMLTIFILMQVAIFSSGLNWTDERELLGFFIGFYGILMPILIYVGGKANMKKMAYLREPLLYHIDEDKIEVQGETFNTTSNWQYVSKFVERKNYFMVHTSSRAFHYLPKDGFEIREDIERLKQIVRNKGIKFKYN